MSYSYSCVLVLTMRFSMHVYDLDLSMHVCLFMHATWHSDITRWGVLTLLDPHVQVSKLRTSGFSLLLIRVAQRKRSRLAEDRLRPYPSRPPCSALDFFCYDFEPSFVQLMIVYLFVFSYLRLSGDVIFL